MPLPVVETPSVVPVTLVLVPPPLPAETDRLVLPPPPTALEVLAPVLDAALAPLIVLVPDTVLVVVIPATVVFEALELATMFALVVPLEVGVDVPAAGDPSESTSGSTAVLEHAVSANQHNPPKKERIDSAILVEDSCKLLGEIERAHGGSEYLVNVAGVSQSSLAKAPCTILATRVEFRSRTYSSRYGSRVEQILTIPLTRALERPRPAPETRGPARRLRRGSSPAAEVRLRRKLACVGRVR
jgi:hypothetical protein